MCVCVSNLTQVYKAVLRNTGEEVAIKVQRPGVEPVILRDLFIFRTLASLFDRYRVTHTHSTQHTHTHTNTQRERQGSPALVLDDAKVSSTNGASMCEQACACIRVCVHIYMCVYNICVCSFSNQRLGCKPELIVDEFGEKLLEELDYQQEARNIQVCVCVWLYAVWVMCVGGVRVLCVQQRSNDSRQLARGHVGLMCVCVFVCHTQDFYDNFKTDPTVKIPWVKPEYCGSKVRV